MCVTTDVPESLTAPDATNVPAVESGPVKCRLKPI
jgi:hypothetical protein